MEQLIIWVLQGLGGFLMTVLWHQVRSRDAELKDIKKSLQDTREQYVHKDDLRELKLELGHRFDKLEDLIRDRKE